MGATILYSLAYRVVISRRAAFNVKHHIRTAFKVFYAYTCNGGGDYHLTEPWSVTNRYTVNGLYTFFKG